MKKLLNNIGMKLLSVLIAFLIWVVVVNGDNPEKTQAFTVKTTVLNQDSLLEAGSVFDIVEGGETTIYVTARRSVLNSLTSSDFTVTADLESINTYTTVPSVSLVPTCTKKGVTIRQEAMRCVPSSMKISIEDKEEKSFIVSVVTSGRVADGYEVGGLKLTRGDTIVIAGSASTLNKIDKITATASVSGLSSTETVSATLRIYDKNGEEMNLDNLEIKRPDGVLLKEAKTDVRVTIWQIQTGIALDVGLVGEVADGYHITGVTTTPETISLVGSSNALKKLDGRLELADAVDVTGISSTIERSIDLSEYLTNYENLRLEEDAATTVSVKVQVEKIDAITISKPISELVIVGQPENMNMVLTPGDKLPVEIQSEEGSTTILQTSDVIATLDLTEYQSEGTYTVPVQIELPEGYTLVNDVTIVVNLVLKEVATEEATENALEG
ncbi:MAG: CdaR family protein [Eubacteriales bacterium]|nr:CdaR family protein [Eubacteriales bacterium]